MLVGRLTGARISQALPLIAKRCTSPASELCRAMSATAAAGSSAADTAHPDKVRCVSGGKHTTAADLVYITITCIHPSCLFTVQVKVALCQLHVTSDKDENISTARAAIQVCV